MKREFALDWEKLLTLWRIERQNYLGAGTQGDPQPLHPLSAPAHAWLTGASGVEQECLRSQDPPYLISQARHRPPTPRREAEIKTVCGWKTTGLNGAQG